MNEGLKTVTTVLVGILSALILLSGANFIQIPYQSKELVTARLGPEENKSLIQAAPNTVAGTGNETFGQTQQSSLMHSDPQSISGLTESNFASASTPIIYFVTAAIFGLAVLLVLRRNVQKENIK
jgi:hypothetical protein